MAKKIGAIVSLSIIGVLILATIIMANINIDYSIKCIKPDAMYVQNSKGQTGVTAEQKDEIFSLIANASKENSLAALFNGEINKSATLKTEKNSFESPTGFYVRFKYNNQQELKQGNSVVKDESGNVCKYSELVFSVNAGVNEDIKVYVLNGEDGQYNYTHYYLLDADFEELAEYLQDHFAE